MTPDPSNLPDPAEDPSELTVGEDALDISLEDGASLDLQAFADEVAETTPETGAFHTGHTVNLDDLELDRAGEKFQLEVAALQGQLSDSLASLKAVEKREQEMMDQFQRLSKDFVNFRSRSARDIQMAVDQAERKLLMEFLPVLDNFERGLESSYPDMDAFRGGVELIRKQFLDALRRVGAEAVPMALGEPFNAHVAEALTTMQRPDLPDGSVAAIYEKAYTLRDQLIRPAKVVVNHRPDASANPPQGYDTIQLDGPGESQ